MNHERYAPLVFEECYVKNKATSKVQNTFELTNTQLNEKVDPTIREKYRGVHLFVMAHGF